MTTKRSRGGARVKRGTARDRVGSYLSDARDELVRPAYLLTGDREAAQDIVHDVIAQMVSGDLAPVERLHPYARRPCSMLHPVGATVDAASATGHQLRIEWERLDQI